MATQHLHEVPTIATGIAATGTFFGVSVAAALPIIQAVAGLLAALAATATLIYTLLRIKDRYVARRLGAPYAD